MDGLSVDRAGVSGGEAVSDAVGLWIAPLRPRFAVWEPLTLSGFLARSAREYGDRPFVITDERTAKRLVWSGLGARVEAQLPEEARTVAELSGTADALEGLAAVIERRAPVFRGRSRH